MDRQSEPPGPEIGWAFGGIGFVATVFVGWLMDAGIGFGLFAVVFWIGIGSLFAFLVERSTIEENDRVEELHNTRLATLAPAAGTLTRPASRTAGEHERDRASSVAPAGSADRSPDGDGADPAAPAGARATAAGPDGSAAGTASRPDGGAPAPDPARRSPRPGRSTARPTATAVTASPRAYREAAAEAAALRDGVDRDRPAFAAYRTSDAPPGASASRDRRPRPEPRPAPGPPRRGGDHHERPSAPRPQPRSPREYREARAEAERQGHAAA